MLDGPQRIETGFVSNAGNIDLFVKNFSIRLCRARCNRLAAFFRFVAVKKTNPPARSHNPDLLQLSTH
jgi:hypothetical protein